MNAYDNPENDFKLENSWSGFGRKTLFLCEFLCELLCEVPCQFLCDPNRRSFL